MKNSPKRNKRRKASLQPQHYPFNKNLPPEEYDFSLIPLTEWNHACEWELEREDTRYYYEQVSIHHNGSFDLEKAEKSVPAPWIQLDTATRESLISYGVQIPVDPTKSRLVIDALKPKKGFAPVISDLRSADALEWENLHSKIISHRSLKRGKVSLFDPTRLFVAEIDPRKPVKEIQKDFSEFLKSFCPKKRTGRKREVAYVLLMDLAIYRICRSGYTTPECINMCKWMDKKGKVPSGHLRRMSLDVAHNNTATTHISDAIKNVQEVLALRYQR